MEQIQSMLNSTGNPPALSSALSDFQAAWTQYAANPSDTPLQKAIISSGQALANEINVIAVQTANIKINVENDLSTTIASLNTALARVQTLNVQITSALSNNQPTVNLEDERAIAINQIAQYTNVTVMQRENGQVALYTPSGTALLDQESRTFSLGPLGNTVVNAAGSDVTQSLNGGDLQAQTDFLATSATTANGVGVFTKLQSQMQNFANIFLATTAGGNSFADTYNTATTGSGEQATDFFTAIIDPLTGLPDITTFSINPDLAEGITTIKVASAINMNNIFSATNAAITTTAAGGGLFTYTTSSSFSAAGLTTQGQNLSGIVTAILSGFQQAANAIKTQSETASAQETYYLNSLSSQTGVNTDTELINLTNWENSYAASAHVISTIQSMMDTLESMVH
jgi:flagellar hook-associated protein 1